MSKLHLETGEDKEIIAWDMVIRIRARAEDIEETDHKEAVEADSRINYLARRLLEYYVNHGLATDYFEREGEIDLGKIGTAEYRLIPVARNE